MLGIDEKNWLVEKLYEQHEYAADRKLDKLNEKNEVYEAYFGLGHSIKLLDQPGVFKVSPAGLVFGNYILQQFAPTQADFEWMDMGTGSGVLALLLRDLGCKKIIASDVSSAAIENALQNELRNFHSKEIVFFKSDLFSGLKRGQKFDRIIFNPPGWRTPSEVFENQAAALARDNEIDLHSMFYGDKVLLKFLTELPVYLKSNGKAIVGLNSMVGIKDVLMQYRRGCAGRIPLKFRLRQRHTFPLLFYTETWLKLKQALLNEFNEQRRSNLAAFGLDSRGDLYWSYELIEISLR